LEASGRRKVPGGKLLAVRLDHDGDRVTSAELSGDFFLFPEESIAVVESALVGIPRSIDEAGLAAMIADTMEREGITAIGFTPQDLASLIKEALG
jgi:lipoate-protein ligase A